MRAKSLLKLVSVLFVVAAFPFAGHAAPQILGLVATATPVPLSCADGVCSVEVSGVCLQEHRAAPVTGTAYLPAEGADLTLVVRDETGAQRKIAVAHLVDIKSLRLFNSVSVSLPEDVIRGMGGDINTASLSIGPMTTLLPVAREGDPNPLSVKEIRDFTGQQRARAEQAIGRDGANRAATQVLNYIVNRLPADRPEGADRIAVLRDRSMGDASPTSTTSSIPTSRRMCGRPFAPVGEAFGTDARYRPVSSLMRMPARIAARSPVGG
jgi:hypothetical protein